jgi:hypothetical protein
MGILQALYEWYLNDVFGIVDNPLLMNTDKMAMYFAWITLIFILGVLGYLVDFVISYIGSFTP